MAIAEESKAEETADAGLLNGMVEPVVETDEDYLGDYLRQTITRECSNCFY